MCVIFLFVISLLCFGWVYNHLTNKKEYVQFSDEGWNIRILKVFSRWLMITLLCR